MVTREQILISDCLLGNLTHENVMEVPAWGKLVNNKEDGKQREATGKTHGLLISECCNRIQGCSRGHQVIMTPTDIHTDLMIK